MPRLFPRDLILRLGDLIAGLDARLVSGEAGCEVAALTLDSRAVTPGAMFAAVPGAKLDGAAFLKDAVAKGAAAVLTGARIEVPAGISLVVAERPRRVAAQLAARLVGKLPRTMVAVTGTNGKTSSVDFLRQIWEHAGWPAASVGTLGIVRKGRPAEASLTTPDPATLARALAGLARDGIDQVALEASSHGLDQGRLDGIPIAAAGFTNLTRDHLDYHGDIQSYAAAKLRLFEELLPPDGFAVAGTELDQDILRKLRDIAQHRGFHLETVGDGGSLFNLARATPTTHGQALELGTPNGPIEIFLPLIGRYQADNVLMAAGLAWLLETQGVLEALPVLQGVRGRLELVARLHERAAAYVDYAHTPDALHRLLQSLRPHCAGRLILVFGAGGDRDAGKRPLMGQVAEAEADIAIVTNDNPRTENPQAIRTAILLACPKGIEIADRHAAIQAALNMAQVDDIVVVAGKGHEQGQIVGTATIPFDDASVIRELAGAL